LIFEIKEEGLKAYLVGLIGGLGLVFTKRALFPFSA